MISYPADIKERVRGIMAERSIRNETLAIEYAIVETYRRLNPAYVRAMAPISPEEKMKRKEEIEKIKSEKYEERLRDVCEGTMGGKLERDANGHFTCTLTQYSYITPSRIVKGERIVGENEIENFPMMQYLKFPKDISNKERDELIKKAKEVS